MSRFLPRLTALLILGLSLAIVSCSSDDPGLLPGDDAQQILSNLDRVEELAANGECSLALEATETISAQIEALPGSVDSKLKQNLRSGVSRLNQVTADSCGVTEGEDTETEPEMPTTPETEETLPSDGNDEAGGTTGPTDNGRPQGGNGDNRNSNSGNSGRNRGQQAGGGNNRSPNAGNQGGGGETPPTSGQPAQPGDGTDTGGISPSEPVTPGSEENP